MAGLKFGLGLTQEQETPPKRGSWRLGLSSTHFLGQIREGEAFNLLELALQVTDQLSFRPAELLHSRFLRFGFGSDHVAADEAFDVVMFIAIQRGGAAPV